MLPELLDATGVLTCGVTGDPFIHISRRFFLVVGSKKKVDCFNFLVVNGDLQFGADFIARDGHPVALYHAGK